jgi:hypothetical protein
MEPTRSAARPPEPAPFLARHQLVALIAGIWASRYQPGSYADLVDEVSALVSAAEKQDTARSVRQRGAA